MLATLHLPGATPRTLLADEVAVLNPQIISGNLTLDFKAGAPALRELLGTAIAGEVLASGPDYLIVGVENAADYDFAANPSATSDFVRLTGVEPDEDEPLVGPLLVFED